MQVVALIMAGGRSKRFGGNVEKPMVRFMGKPLIRRVIEAAKDSKKISETYVVVTSYSPRTAMEAAEASVKVIETKGQGYHADLQQAVQVANLTGPILTISSDLPLISGEFLDKVIGKYEKAGKPALTVLVPEEAFCKYGISAVSPYEYEGKTYAVSGINMIDGRRVMEWQEQEVVVSSRPEAVFNVNSSQDLESAKNYLLRTKRDSRQDSK